MSEQQLRAMLNYASDFAERRFAQQGVIYPLYHAITSGGEQLIEPAPSPDKDVGVAIIRALFDLRDVVRYVFFDEAWTLEKLVQPEELAWIERHGVRKHPQRVEVVMFQGEDSEAGQISAHRKIIRPKNGRAYLGPLEMLIDLPHFPQGATYQSEGRMVGLLPVRGLRQ
jgi:hypothetical protein